MFADQGFAGASVRDICKSANASSTMIHHYFGNKEGLLNAIIEEFTLASFDVPLRLISKPAQSPEEFRLRLEMFISETFWALVSQAPVFRILVRENKGFVGMANFHRDFAAYLTSAQSAGIVSADLKIELVTGLVLDRLGNQVMYAATSPKDERNVLNDKDYAAEWLAANTDVLIKGLS